MRKKGKPFYAARSDKNHSWLLLKMGKEIVNDSKCAAGWNADLWIRAGLQEGYIAATTGHREDFVSVCGAGGLKTEIKTEKRHILSEKQKEQNAYV